MATTEISVAEQVRAVPSAVRPIVQAARRAVRAAAPDATELAYQSHPPRSRSAMWKIVRYSREGEPVVGIGVFSTYVTMFFARGRELADPSGLLEGSGRDARFLRLHRPSDATAPALAALLRAAFALRPATNRASKT